MRVGNPDLTDRRVAGLNDIKATAAGKAIPEVSYGRVEAKGNGRQERRFQEAWYPYPANSIRPRVFELCGKNGEFVLFAQLLQAKPVRLPDSICLNDDIVEDCNFLTAGRSDLHSLTQRIARSSRLRRGPFAKPFISRLDCTHGICRCSQ